MHLTPWEILYDNVKGGACCHCTYIRRDGSKEEGTSASSMLERQLRFNELAVHTGDEGEA
jgi:hypothetical protein